MAGTKRRMPKNPLVLAAMREQGFRSVKQLCEQAGVWPTEAGRLLRGLAPPFSVDGWTPNARRLADTLHAHPADFWPEAQATMEIPARDWYTNPVDPLTRLLQQEAKGRVADLLAHLKPKEAHVLRRRFGLTVFGEPASLEEIGRELGVSRERIRQLEANGLWALRKRFCRMSPRFFLEDLPE